MPSLPTWDGRPRSAPGDRGTPVGPPVNSSTHAGLAGGLGLRISSGSAPARLKAHGLLSLAGMQRLLLGLVILTAAAVLAGCPVYPGRDYRVCDGNGCFDCPDPFVSSACVGWSCATAADCPNGYACDSANSGTCIAGPAAAGACSTPADCTGGLVCGQDGSCHAGDCVGSGCPSGYVCKLANGQPPQCLPAPSGGPVEDGGSADVSSDAATPPVVDAASERAASDASSDSPETPDAGVPSVPCNSDAPCGGAGAKCLNGQCTPQAHLCSDTTQCIVAGEACVDGVCLPHCSNAAPCPAGYACDFTRGVCNAPLPPCSSAGPSTCAGGAVCVESRCVSPCGPGGDAGAACPSGQVCVNGGCIPDERAQFACLNDGQSGLLANDCGSSSVCLHHSCYPQCGPDAGGCAGANPVCKQVTVTAGTYGVCATSSDLGSDCDPAVAGKTCPSGSVCIDGYCK
jgi:hypothetical protein